MTYTLLRSVLDSLAAQGSWTVASLTMAELLRTKVDAFPPDDEAHDAIVDIFERLVGDMTHA